MNGWIPWDGKRPFRGDKLLRVRFRCGVVSKEVLPAHKWRGKWGGQPRGKRFPDKWDYDIVAVLIQS